MFIFRSNNQEDIDFAREHGIWQSPKYAKGLKIGDLVALQRTGTKDILVVGRATTEMYEDVPCAWPGDKQNYTKTVRFDKVDLKGQWNSKNI